MQIDYSLEKTHKCPYCPLSCPDLERFKQHLINCRKCNDKQAYVCKYYFGHVFQTGFELDEHLPDCIFNKGPVLYPNEKRITLGKSSKDEIMKESCPNRPIHYQNLQMIPPAPQNNHIVVIDEKSPKKLNDVSTSLVTTTKTEILCQKAEYENNFQDGDDDIFHYYVFEDIPTRSNFHLLYSFGIEFAKNMFKIESHHEITEFGNFFAEQEFDRAKFKSYASLYSLFSPATDTQSFNFFRKSLGNKIGINKTRAESHNEVLVVVTPDSENIGKFVPANNIAFLVVPASQLLNLIQMPGKESFYKKSEFRNQKDSLPDPKVEAEKKKTFKEKLFENIDPSKIQSLISWMTELQNSQVSITELQDLSQALDMVTEELEHKQRKERLEKNKQAELIKKEIQEKRMYINELRQLLNQKEKEIQQAEEVLIRDKNNARAKYERTLQSKLDECDKIFTIKKEEIEHEISSISSYKEKLSLSIASLSSDVQQLQKAYEASTKELSDLNTKLERLAEESSDLTRKEKDSLKDTGISQGIPKLSDFTCVSCKKRNKEVIFLPCRHMLWCNECVKSLKKAGSQKCKECDRVIKSKMIIEKVEYKIPFDEILNKNPSISLN